MPDPAAAAAPPAVAGWRIVLYPLDGGDPQVLNVTKNGRSLHYCRTTLANWRGSFADDGKTEAVIEPLAGWEALGGDPVLAVCMGIGRGDLPPDLGAQRIRALYDGGGG